MSEETTVVSGLKCLGQSVSPDDVDRWRARFAIAEAGRERYKRQQFGEVTLIVGTHAGCGGSVQYRSWFAPACSPEEMRFDGSNPVREQATCSCQRCGVAYNPYFPPYRNQVVAYRNREGE